MYIAQAAYAFRISGQPVCCVDFGHGHINRTLKITTDTGHMYVLQRINKYVFKDPVKVMANASAVTNYLLDRCSDPRAALHFIPTLQGQYYHRDQEGEFWRMYDFVDSFCLDTPESAADFYESALAFGTFQELLSDFPAHNLIRARRSLRWLRIYKRNGTRCTASWQKLPTRCVPEKENPHVL